MRGSIGNSVMMKRRLEHGWYTLQSMNLHITFAADYLLLKIQNMYKALLQEMAFDNGGNSIQR